MKGNLLLIDDEQMILDTSELILQDLADKIFLANSGKIGLEIFEREKIHCIVCDINMPRMNGIEVLKAIRSLNSDIPFIFYTGHGDEVHMKEAVKLNAFDFLSKPVLEGLEELIQRGLEVGMGMKPHGPLKFVSDYRRKFLNQSLA